MTGLLIYRLTIYRVLKNRVNFFLDGFCRVADFREFFCRGGSFRGSIFRVPLCLDDKFSGVFFFSEWLLSGGLFPRPVMLNSNGQIVKFAG